MPMRIADFALERYFARWEFAVEHLLCASDVQGVPMAELLALADDETRALWDGLTLGYTESTGHPLLRREIAGALRAASSADDVLVFAGAEEAIFCLANVLLGPGDHAVVTWPGYQSLYEVARAAGADVTLHELHEADGWALDVDAPAGGRSRPATRLVVVNAPHNPTGMLPTAARVGRADRRRSPSAGSTSSPTRSTASSSSTRRTACRPAPTPSSAAISLGVMSKSFAMAGLRIGWLATRDRDLLARCAAFKDYTTICSSAPSEILALIGLRARDRVLARSRGDRRPRTSTRLDGFFEDWADRFDVGPPARRLDRLPAAHRAGRPHRRLGGRAGRGGGRPAPARVRVRPPGQPLPARVRADRPARGARPARGVRDATLR